VFEQVTTPRNPVAPLGALPALVLVFGGDVRNPERLQELPRSRWVCQSTPSSAEPGPRPELQALLFGCHFPYLFSEAKVQEFAQILREWIISEILSFS
jgi:hypothetical protein